MFSFNNPFGACEKCSGIGMFMKVDPRLVVPDASLSINDGAIKASGWNGRGSWNNPHLASFASMYYEGLSNRYGFSLDAPFEQLPESAKEVLLYGSGDEEIEFTRKSDWGGGTYKSVFLRALFRISKEDTMKPQATPHVPK